MAISIAVSALLVAVSSYIYMLTRREEQTVRIILASSPWLLHLLICEAIVRTFDAPWNFWTHQFLASSIAFVLGEPVYTLQGDGPYISWMYGPLSALSYLPTAFVTDPVSAMRLGEILTLGFGLASLLIVTLLAVVPEKEKWAHVLAIVVSSFFFFLWDRVLSETFQVRFELPAIFMSVLSIVVLASNDRSIGKLLVSALLAASAVWIKQTFVVVPVAIVVSLIIARRAKSARTWAAACIAFGAIGLGIFSLWLGFAPLKFIMVDYPGSFQWVSDISVGIFNFDTVAAPSILARISVVAKAIWECLYFVLPLVILLLILVGARISLRELEHEAGPGLSGLRFLTVCTTVCAILFVPIGALSRVKLGGWINLYTPVSYFLLLSCVGLYLQLVSHRRQSRVFMLSSLYALAVGLAVFQAGKYAAVLLCVPAYIVFRQIRIPSGAESAAIACVLLALSVPFIGRNHGVVMSVLSRTEVSELESAHAYATANPGKVYFYNAPLLNLLTEKKLYNTSSGVLDYLHGGYVVSRAEFLRHVPNDMAILAVRDEDQLIELQEYFPEYSQPIEVEELRGFYTFRKNE